MNLTVQNLHDITQRLMANGFGDKQVSFNNIEYLCIKDSDVTIGTAKKSKGTCINIDLTEST